jgi:hypothetical protein
MDKHCRKLICIYTYFIGGDREVSAWQCFIAVLVLANVIKCTLGISDIDEIFLVPLISMYRGHCKIEDGRIHRLYLHT